MGDRLLCSSRREDLVCMRLLPTLAPSMHCCILPEDVIAVELAVHHLSKSDRIATSWGQIRSQRKPMQQLVVSVSIVRVSFSVVPVIAQVFVLVPGDVELH
jgi:hypothetical protein